MTQESVTFLKNFLVKLGRKSMIILSFFPILHRGGFYQVFIRSINRLIPPLCIAFKDGVSAIEIVAKPPFFFILFEKQNVKFTCLEKRNFQFKAVFYTVLEGNFFLRKSHL